MKRILVHLFVGIILIGTFSVGYGLELTAIAGPAAVVTAEQRTTPEPAPASEIVEIRILSNPLGSLGYVASFAMADLINKNSPWLRATCAETKSTAVNARTLAEEPEKRKNTIIYCAVETLHVAVQGRAPYKKPYKSARIVSLLARMTGGFITYDKNIKRLEDFAGKKVSIMARYSSPALMSETILRYWGVWDKVKPAYLGWGAAKDALIDGTIDVMYLPGSWMGGTKYRLNPAATEAVKAKKDVYYINFPEQKFKKMLEETGFPITWTEIAPGTFPKQTEPLGISLTALQWYADLEMDEKVVYEICRVMYENADKLGSYHGIMKALTKENLSRTGTEADFHPGARRFFKEKGAKFGW